MRKRERETRQTYRSLSPQQELFRRSGITVRSGRGGLMRVTLHIYMCVCFCFCFSFSFFFLQEEERVEGRAAATTLTLGPTTCWGVRIGRRKRKESLDQIEQKGDSSGPRLPSAGGKRNNCLHAHRRIRPLKTKTTTTTTKKSDRGNTPVKGSVEFIGVRCVTFSKIESVPLSTGGNVGREAECNLSKLTESR